MAPTKNIKPKTGKNLKKMMKWLNSDDGEATYRYGQHKVIEPKQLKENLESRLRITENQASHLIEVAKTAGFLVPVYKTEKGKKASMYAIPAPENQQPIKKRKKNNHRSK